MTIQVYTFKILTNGTDGGHTYIETEIVHNGKTRRLTAFFNDKFEEARIKPGVMLTIKGILQDDGEDYGFLLNESEIVNK